MEYMNAQPQDIVVAGQAMRLRPLCPADAPALIGLHNQVFGSGVDRQWFNWKYGAGSGAGLGIGLWHDGQMIAFCGGVPRQFCLGDLPQTRAAFLQIGDVMVRPDWRGVLTRRGVFYTVSQAFYDTYIGANAAFAAGFGFPSARHLQLADKLGLLRGVGEMVELSWSSAAATPSDTSLWRWRLQPITPEQDGFDKTLATCWARMRQSLPRALLGERTPAYVRWRFGSRPHAQCEFWALKRPWPSRPLGLLVVSQPVAGQPCRWLDWIGPAQGLALAGRMAWRRVQGAGVQQMSTWASAEVAALLGPQAHSQQAAAPIGAPTRSLLPSPGSLAMPWWFMAGDTDFL
jgi:hypothetical protein